MWVGDADAVGGGGADADREGGVRREEGGDPGGDASQRDSAAALGDRLGRGRSGEGDHLVGWIAGEHGPPLGRHRPPGQARGPVEDGEELVGVGGVGGDAGFCHLLGVVLAVAGDGLEAHDRQPGGEGLHAREPPGVLHQSVGRCHQGGHLVGPAEDVPAVVALEPAAQLLVVAAHHDGRKAAGREDRVVGLGHIADAPGAGDHEDEALAVVEAQRPAGGGAGGQVGEEALGDHRSRCGGGPARASGRRLGRLRMHAHVEVDAGMGPQRVDGEVGDEGGDRNAEPPLLAGRAQDQRRHGVGRDDDVGVRLAHPAQHLAARQKVDEGAERLEDERQHVPEPVGRFVRPRCVPQLEPVAGAHEPPHPHRKGVEEIDHLGGVPPVM